MRRPVTLLVAAAWSLVGCGHSRHVESPPPAALSAVDVDESGVPFAPAPEGLLRPHAPRALQTKLYDKGFLAPSERSDTLDAPTREALRHFQESIDLPATGLPSYRTVEKLGLEPDRIFFSAHRPPAGPEKQSVEQGSVGAR